MTKVINIKELINCKKGQALMEFAIVVPLLMVLVLWIISISLQFYSNVVVANATREAARYAAIKEVNFNDANDKFYEVLELHLITVIPTPTYSDIRDIVETNLPISDPNDWVKIKVTLDYTPFVNYEVLYSLLVNNPDSNNNNKLVSVAAYKNEREF